MGKARREAFSDGVLAIIIAIIVLELKVPHGDSLSALLTGRSASGSSRSQDRTSFRSFIMFPSSRVANSSAGIGLLK
jgi:hypothetical protein